MNKRDKLTRSSTFEYLLNAMENAAAKDRPADHDYFGKRQAVLKYVSDQGDALVSAEQRVGELTAELAKCGRENCFGQEVEGCRRWVSEESLLRSKARVAALQEALPIVLKEWERAFRRSDWDADEAHEIRKRISGAEAALFLKAKEPVK